MRCTRRLVPLLLLLMPAFAHAQSLAIDLGATGQAGATGRLVQITALVTVLSLAPSLLVMVTAFTRIVIVLSLLRSALATQGTPPNIVLIGLALFLTFFVMQPVLEAVLDHRVFCRSPKGASARSKVCVWPPSRSIIS